MYIYTTNNMRYGILMGCSEYLWDLPNQKRTIIGISWNVDNHLETLDADESYKGLPSGYVKITIENGHRNSEFSHQKLWFSSSLCKRLPEGI